MINTITIIGVGLIGGSFAQSIRAQGHPAKIIGCGRSVENLQKAQELGVIDLYSTDIAESVKECDLIFLATPVGAIAQILPHLKSAMDRGAILTDAGSTKGSVVDAVRDVFGTIPARFVPGHPIAGTENSGVEASFSTLYQQRRVILTPLAETEIAALDQVRKLWELCGAVLTEMSVGHHDEVLAATSHLPHMLAFTLVDTLANLEEHQDIFRYAAGGFRDFTRIASSNPQMWHDITMNNRQALIKMIGAFSADLQRLQQSIEKGESDSILELFQRAKSERDAYVIEQFNE